MDRNTALAFAAGAVTGAAAIHVVLNVTRAKPARETPSSGPSSSKQASKAFVDDADEDVDGVAELEQEQFSRNIAFLEDSGFNRVRDARIIVVGLGGVGSHTAHMLARSGARHLRIIDFDQVTLPRASTPCSTIATRETTTCARTIEARLRPSCATTVKHGGVRIGCLMKITRFMYRLYLLCM